MALKPIDLEAAATEMIEARGRYLRSIRLGFLREGIGVQETICDAFGMLGLLHYLGIVKKDAHGNYAVEDGEKPKRKTPPAKAGPKPKK